MRERERESVCVCVCVCVKEERERERERERGEGVEKCLTAPDYKYTVHQVISLDDKSNYKKSLY